ncbi:thioredoxin family protein [Caldithrix abyssi]
MKNLTDYFEKALLLKTYLSYLGDQRALHELHYRRAQVGDFLPISLPELKILVITEPWCGDSTAILPVLQKFFENKPAEIRIALRDEQPKLMDLFLTNGARAIPIVVVLDKDGRYLFRFGPRPEAARQIFENYRPLINQGKIEKVEVLKKIRQFYAKDQGRAILTELVEKLTTADHKNETIEDV